MSQKAALKSIRTALDSKDYEEAATKASELCQQDSRSYHGWVPPKDEFSSCINSISFRHVFLGLALDKLKLYDEAEQAYQTATKIKDNDRTAWQGLLNLYESQGSSKLDNYGSTVIRLCQIFAEGCVLPTLPSPVPTRMLTAALQR